MTNEVASAEKLFQKARKDFVTLASRTSQTLARDARRLGRELQRANARVANLRTQQRHRAEKLASSAGAAARRRLRVQVRKLTNMLEDAIAEAGSLRDMLQPVRAQLKSARAYVQRAHGVDRLLDRLEKEWDKAAARSNARRRRARVAKAPARGRRKPAAKKSAARARKKKVTAKKRAVRRSRRRAGAARARAGARARRKARARKATRRKKARAPRAR